MASRKQYFSAGHYGATAPTERFPKSASTGAFVAEADKYERKPALPAANGVDVSVAVATQADGSLATADHALACSSTLLVPLTWNRSRSYWPGVNTSPRFCLLYTSDAADEEDSVD